MKANTFNPVKEEMDGQRARRVIWTTEALNAAIKGLDDGRKLVANPFYENNTRLLKGDLVFQRTPAEIEEWKKCANDIIYFVNTYCKLMTPQGIKNITLRNYQENYLRHLMKHRLSIFLSCRQSGKCVSYLTKVKIKITQNVLSDIADKLKKYLYCNYYNSTEDCFELPLFELQNLYDKRFVWKLKYVLYKKLYKITQYEYKCSKTSKIYCALNILDLFDKSKYELDATGKIVNSFALKDVKVFTDTGWKDAGFLHETKRFRIWTIITKNHILHCADLHKVFNKNFQEVFCDELKIGDEIITEDGIEKITKIQQSVFSQNMCDLTVMNENSRYYTNGILSHNTTTSALFMLHYILFNVDKNALVLGNKRKTACEILDKAKKIFLELPYFLRPGVYKWNEGEIVLDNGCRLMAEATTINSGISFTFHCVLADEFAHIHPNIIDKFYNNLFPTITAGKARFMITSTQNGYNLFYRLYKAAEAHENEYAAFKTDWDEVPEWNPEKQCWEERDEEWHRMQVANYGSEEAFNAQFGTHFDVSANTLIDTHIIRKFEREGVEFVRREIPGVSFAEHFYWHPDYEISNMKKDFFVITTDISEGVSGDDTVYIFNKLCFNQSENLVYTETIGYFKYNKVNAQQATTVLKEFCSNYMDINRYLVSLEYNLYGELFAKYIMENIEQDPQNVYAFNEDVIMKYWDDNMKSFKLGKKITSKTKQLGTSLFKRYYEKGDIVNKSLQFVNQVSNFCDTKGNGTYAASFGHDDLVMAQLQMVYVIENPQYKTLCQMFLAAINANEMTNAYNPYENNAVIDMSQMQDFYNFQQTQFNVYQQLDSWQSYEQNSNLRRLIGM